MTENKLHGYKNFFLITLFFSAIAHSAVLAVLEITPSIDIEELTIGEYRLLSDELRRQAVNILPAREFTVLTRDGIIALIPPDEKEAECLAQSCAVDIGRAIGAEYISTGRVAKFAGKLSLTIELYETMSGKLLGSILTYGADLVGLMETIKAESPAMFGKIKGAGIESGIRGGNSPPGLPKWVAVGLDILGAGAIGFGIYQNSRVVSHKKSYDKIPLGSQQGDFDSAYEKVESSQNMRNAGYIAGGVLLLGGISMHIFF